LYSKLGVNLKSVVFIHYYDMNGVCDT